jgi:hypothetical protein
MNYEFHTSDELEDESPIGDIWVVRAVEHYEVDITAPPPPVLTPGLLAVANLIRSAAPAGDGKRTRVLMTNQAGIPSVETLPGHWELHDFGNLVAPQVPQATVLHTALLPGQYDAELKVMPAAPPWSQPRQASPARKPRKRGKRKHGRTQAERDYTAQVRDWARGQGMAVADHGRLPARVHLAYENRPVSPDE